MIARLQDSSAVVLLIDVRVYCLLATSNSKLCRRTR